MENEKLLTNNKNKFGIFEAALATILFVFFNYLFMQSYYSFARNWGITKFGILIAQFLVEALFGVTAWVVAALCKKNIVKAAGLDKKVSIYMFLYGALIAFCGIIFLSGLTSSFIELLELIGYKSSSSSMTINNFGTYIGYVIAACITPAVCEEILFRGTIQAGLKKYGKWASIISASLIFMLMHGGPEQTVHQFIIGIIVGYMFFETGNIWLGVIVHFFNNFISITELYIYNIITASTETVVETTTETLTTAEMLSEFAITLSISIIMAIVGYFIIKYLMKKLIQEDRKVNGNNLASASNQTQTILVDGQEVEASVDLSNSQDEVVVENINTQENTDESENRPMTSTEKLLFAIPICWMIFEWFYSLICGF